MSADIIRLCAWVGGSVELRKSNERPNSITGPCSGLSCALPAFSGPSHFSHRGSHFSHGLNHHPHIQPSTGHRGFGGESSLGAHLWISLIFWIGGLEAFLEIQMGFSSGTKEINWFVLLCVCKEFDAIKQHAAKCCLSFDISGIIKAPLWNGSKFDYAASCTESPRLCLRLRLLVRALPLVRIHR